MSKLSENLKRNSRLSYRRHKAEARARGSVAYARKQKRLVRQPCEICGGCKTDAHHDDYNKPLEVRWLCRNCHKEWHMNNKPIRPFSDKRIIECIWCGKEFEPKEQHQLLCSIECKREYIKKRRHENYMKNREHILAQQWHYRHNKKGTKSAQN